jgi:hypothetical protein
MNERVFPSGPLRERMHASGKAAPSGWRAELWRGPLRPLLADRQWRPSFRSCRIYILREREISWSMRSRRRFRFSTSSGVIWNVLGFCTASRKASLKRTRRRTVESSDMMDEVTLRRNAGAI